MAGLNPVADPSVIVGKLWGWPGGKFRVEVYMNSLGNPSGNGEGERLIAVKDFNDPDPVMTDASGIADFQIVSTVPLIGGEVISATATDDANNTSEFAPSVLAGTISRIYGATDDLEGAEAGRFVVNTTFSGSPLYWPDGKADYTVSSSVPADLQGAMNAAFDAWEGITGLPNGVSLQFSSGGPAADPQKWGGAPDGINHLVFICSDWETATGSSEFATAVTRVRYSALTGAITDADIAFNCDHFQFRNYPLPGGAIPADNMFDAQSIATHEIGHLLGLGDQYNRGDPYASLFHGAVPCAGDVTMYGIVTNTDTYQRIIGVDDVKGLSLIYSFVPRAAIDLVLVFDGSQSFDDATTFNGFDASVGAATELVDKMRDGDRVAVYKLTQSTPYIPFTTIDALSRASVKQTLGLLQPDLTDTRPLGTGLTNAAGYFTGTDVARRAIILFSAGNETGSPSALSQSVLDALRRRRSGPSPWDFLRAPRGPTSRAFWRIPRAAPSMMRLTRASAASSTRSGSTWPDISWSATQPSPPTPSATRGTRTPPSVSRASRTTPSAGRAPPRTRPSAIREELMRRPRRSFLRSAIRARAPRWRRQPRAQIQVCACPGAP